MQTARDAPTLGRPRSRSGEEARKAHCSNVDPQLWNNQETQPPSPEESNTEFELSTSGTECGQPDTVQLGPYSSLNDPFREREKFGPVSSFPTNSRRVLRERDHCSSTPGRVGPMTILLMTMTEYPITEAERS